MTYDTSYPTRTLAEVEAENRAAREALERREELRKGDSIIWNMQKIRVRMNDALKFGKEQVTMTPQTFGFFQDNDPRKEEHARRFGKTNQQLDAEDKAALGSIKSERKAKSSAANGRKGGRPRKEQMSILCKQDLHAECDDAANCACGCHLKPNVYTR